MLVKSKVSLGIVAYGHGSFCGKAKIFPETQNGFRSTIDHRHSCCSTPTVKVGTTKLAEENPLKLVFIDMEKEYNSYGV